MCELITLYSCNKQINETIYLLQALEHRETINQQQMRQSAKQYTLSDNDLLKHTEKCSEFRPPVLLHVSYDNNS